MNELAGLPTQIGRYAVTGLLGQGGMGRVVRARDPQLQRDVAIKLVEAEALDEPNEARFMFHREARAIARLTHPNVIEVYEYSGPDAELPYIVCELVEAPTLRDVLEGRGITLQPAVAAALAYEIALALEHAHTRGVVHRDVKPENVFWTPSGRVVLADFGIAKAFGTARFASTIQFGATSLYGSPSYMAPEQVRGAEVDARTDVHALGAVLFEVLVGAPPYLGDSIDELLRTVERGEHTPVPHDIGPATLVGLIEQMLAADPSARPATARMVAERLRRVLDELDVRDPRAVLDQTEISRTIIAAKAPDRASERAKTERVEATRLVPLQRPRGPQNWLIVAVGLTVLVAAGLAAFWSVQPPKSSAPVDVTIVLPGASELFVDGRSFGPVRDVQRTRLTPGRHALEAKVYASGQTLKREIYVVSGSGEAQFEL